MINSQIFVLVSRQIKIELEIKILGLSIKKKKNLSTFQFERKSFKDKLTGLNDKVSETHLDIYSDDINPVLKNFNQSQLGLYDINPVLKNQLELFPIQTV